MLGPALPLVSRACDINFLFSWVSPLSPLVTVPDWPHHKTIQNRSEIWKWKSFKIKWKRGINALSWGWESLCTKQPWLCFLDIYSSDCQQLKLPQLPTPRLRECHVWWSVDGERQRCAVKREREWYCLRVMLSIRIGPDSCAPHL